MTELMAQWAEGRGHVFAFNPHTFERRCEKCGDTLIKISELVGLGGPQTCPGVQDLPQLAGTTRRKRVYIAGPLESSGKTIANIRGALEAAHALLQRGYAPYVPHLSALWDLATPATREQWIALDDEFLRICDCLLRCEGSSDGADREVELMRSLGRPCYFSLDTLCACEFAVVYAATSR